MIHMEPAQHAVPGGEPFGPGAPLDGRVPILGRVRASSAGDESTSADQQVRLITKWADDNNGLVVAWAIDENVSGSKDPFTTPQFGPYLTDPDKIQLWDIVVAINMSRLCRKQEWYIKLYHWCEEQRKSISVLDTPLDMSNPLGRSIAYLYAGFAEEQLNTIKKGNNKSQDELRQLGRWHGSQAPYGYEPTKVPDGGWILTPHPDEKKIVEEIYTRVKDGDSYYIIAQDLNARNVPTKRRGRKTPHRWTNRTIWRMVKSVAPLGATTHNGEPLRDDDGILRILYEPLVDYGLWQEVQTIIEGRTKSNTPKRRSTGKTLLLNVLYCSICGYGMYNGSSQGRYYWRCGGRANHATGCDTKAVPAPMIESWVSDCLLSEIGGKERTHRVFVPATGSADELATVQAAIDRARKESDVGAVDDEVEYIARLTRLTARKKELAAIPNTPARWEDRPTGETYAQAWERMTVPERRTLMIDAGVRVEACMVATGVPEFRMYLDTSLIAQAVPTYDAAAKAAEREMVPDLPEIEDR